MGALFRAQNPGDLLRGEPPPPHRIEPAGEAPHHPVEIAAALGREGDGFAALPEVEPVDGFDRIRVAVLAVCGTEGGEVVLPEEDTGCGCHGSQIQRHIPAGPDIACFERVRPPQIETIAVALARCRVPRMEALLHRPGRFDPDTGGQHRMQGPDQLAAVVRPWRIEVETLPPCVHPGIRAPTAVGERLRVEDPRECGFEDILHSTATGLALPAVKVRPVIRANTLPSHAADSCQSRFECKARPMPDLQLWQYLLMAAGAFCVGLGKGGLPGVGNLTVVLMALALPAKVSVGVLLPILIAADVVAVLIYRRHAEWAYIVKLAPWTIAGILLGYLVFSRVDDATVRVLIGAILLSMTAIHFLRKWMRRKAQGGDWLPHHPAFVGATGVTGGFATMIANAAGPVAALYFIASGLPKYAFIGTSAWFFFLVNLFKVPFMMDLGILHFDSLGMSASFMPYAIAGALIARSIVKHINQRLFEVLIWVFVVIGGLKLILP